MNNVVLGNPFFRKYTIRINPGENILKLPEMTFELNEINFPGEGRKTNPKRRYPVVMSQKVIIKPQLYEILHTNVDFRNNFEGHAGGIISDEDLEISTEFRLSSSVVTVGEGNKVSISAINLNNHAIVFTKNKQVAVFQSISPQDEEDLIEIGPEILAPNKLKIGEILREINQIMRVGKTRGGRQLKGLPPKYNKIWFPPPENCQNLSLQYRAKFSTT